MEALIVHLSDLHFKNDAENKKRLEYLKTDLARLRVDGPIYTAFTGDLIHAGDQKDDYELLLDELLFPLIDLGHEILTVPGNHDIQRSIATESITNTYLNDTTSSYLFDRNGSIIDPHESLSCDPLANYMALEDLFGPYDQRSYYGYTRSHGSFSFAGLNSTWLSRSRRDKDTDRGKLRVEPYVLDKLAQSLSEDTLKIALLHHPLDWLEETTKDAVVKILTKNFDMALFGHVHTSDLSKLTYGTSDCLFVQSPPIRANWSKGTNGYSIIRTNVEARRFEIEYRSYSASRRTFVRGVDFAPNGILHPREEDIAFFKKTPSEESLIMKYCDAQPFDFTAWYRDNIRAKSRKIFSFITPKARRLPLDQEDNWLEPAESISAIVRRSTRDQFFIAPLDAGSTTAAFLTFKSLSETFEEHRKVPAFFDSKEHKINKASLLREISRTSLINYSHAEVESLSSKGALCVVVDGLSLADVEQFNLFRNTAENYFPSVRFIYFLSTERRGSVPAGNLIPNLNTSEDEIYNFAQLEVADIREMVSLHRPGINLNQVDGVVSQVVESFRQMDEPIFASSIAVVIETLSQDPEFKPINKARLLERYVECLLGWFDIEDVREGVFASSDKIDLLSYVARAMLVKGSLGINEPYWHELCSHYQENYLIDLPKGLLDEFIEKGIMTISNSEITFRGDYLFSFFVARQMKADPLFADSLTKGEALFTYHKEIAFYGDLEGTDTRAVLSAIFVALQSLESSLADSYSDVGINLREEWRAACDESSDVNASMSAFTAETDRLNGANPTLEHADRFSDNQLTEVARRRGVAARPEVRELEARLLVSMKLYALLIKNALQVPADEKLKHLQMLYEAAELWVGFLCAMRNEITTQPIVIAGGIVITNVGALVDSEKSAREFKFNAPNSLSRILSESLRNAQLATALRRVLPKLTAMGALFARDALLELPSEDNRAAYIKSLTEESDINLATGTLRTLRSRFLASGRSEEQRQHLEELIKAIGKQKRTAGELNFEKLKKARLVRDLKERANRRRLQ